MKKIFLLIFMLFIISNFSYAFYDESDYYWAKDKVNRWTNSGIVSGYIDGTFRGNNKITRAEVVCIMNKLNNSNKSTNKKPAKDVEIGKWYFEEMSKAVESNIIEIDNNKNLRPNDFATREEVFEMLANLLKIKYNGNSQEYLKSKFKDFNNINYKTVDKIAGVVEENIVNGYEDRTIKPKDYITRAEVICIIDNAISRIYKSGKYNDDVIYGNVLINQSDVELNNCKVYGKIYVLDGANEKIPTFYNTTATKGIVSRTGDIISKFGNNFETLTEKNSFDQEEIDKTIAYIRYDNDNWTNEEVIATLRLYDDNCEIINNSGDDEYTFYKNGKFVFECEKEGNIKRFVAKVDWIDRVKPQFDLIKSFSGDNKSVSVNVNIKNEDGLSPIGDMYFIKGTDTYNIERYGNKIEENIFSVQENYEYTVVVLDEAGNRSEQIIEINEIGKKTNTEGKIEEDVLLEETKTEK